MPGRESLAACVVGVFGGWLSTVSPSCGQVNSSKHPLFRFRRHFLGLAYNQNKNESQIQWTTKSQCCQSFPGDIRSRITASLSVNLYWSESIAALICVGKVLVTRGSHTGKGRKWWES